MSKATIVGVSGGVGSSRRTTALVQKVLDAAESRDRNLSVDLIDLQEDRLPLCDGTPPDQQVGTTRSVIKRLAAADAVVLGTPVYRASFSAVLKNLLDILPTEALLDRPVAIAVTGGSRDHFLVGDYSLRPVLMAMGARIQGPSIYADPSTDEGKGRLALRSAIAAAAGGLIDAIADRDHYTPARGQEEEKR